MKTPIEALIDMVKSVPQQTLTKENVLHMLNNMLPTEQEHLESMANPYNDALKQMGIHGITGKELFERRYKGVEKYNGFV
jgi:hypothetical protein